VSRPAQARSRVGELILMALLAGSGALPAFALEVHRFDVPEEEAATAIRDFGEQAHVQILVAAEAVKGKKLHAVTGQLSTEDGLNALLSGSGLTHRYVGDHSIALLAAQASAAPSTQAQVAGTAGAESGTQEGKNDPSGNFLLAQATPGQTPSASTVEKQDEQSSEKKKKEQLQEVVVTGSRIPTAAGQLTLPVLSYTREDIENSGQTTMGEFLNTLPDVSNFQSSFQIGFGGMQTVQLHGLPVGTTLTLLDGRRLETNVLGFFDLSNIPLAAVERIEILPVGASAIYGADGLGGAVNTILRRDFNGFEANATWEHASGVNDPSGNLAWGKSWEQGSVSLIGSYQERGELLGTQREPTSLTSFPNLPPATLSVLTGANSCAPGNVYSVDGSNLPGLSSPEAAIPGGITGKPTIGQFAATAGTQNLCNALRYMDITPQSQREGALLSAHYEVARSMDLFTEVLFSHGTVEDQIGPQISVSPFDGTVAANNPYNPFGEAVNVSFAYPGAGTVAHESTSLVRPLIGMRGAFLSDWHYEVTAYLSKDRFSFAELSSDTQGIINALASSDPATALNPFTRGSPGTPQLLSSFLNPAVDSTTFLYDDRIVGGQGILRGPLLQLPAGAVQVVIGGEYSQQKQDSSASSNTGAPSEALQRRTYAAFSEARIPLLAPSDPAQGGERLALTLAGRYDHSNDYGGKATWQSGLLWRPSAGLSVSASYGLSYQAPQLSEISGPQSAGVFPLEVLDPFRGNQLVTYPVEFVSGPNFNLKPETGDSFTLGLQYASQALPGLHTSLTWYDLRISNYIGTEAVSTFLMYPSLFPGAVIRAPPTLQDQQQGFLGVITQLNDIYYNFGDIRVSGFDADISYAIDTRVGQFTPSVAIANIYRWQSAVLAGAPEINGVSAATGLFTGFGGVGWSPRWKGTAGLAWKQGPLSMNVAGRYIGRYLDYQLFVPNTNEIGNTWIFDFNTRFEIGQALASTNPWLKGSYVAFGAVNLLNKTPPFSYTPYMYDLEEYDIRGRYLHLNVGLRF
jgi:iron complex outermembrane receptor protein